MSTPRARRWAAFGIAMVSLLAGCASARPSAKVQPDTALSPDSVILLCREGGFAPIYDRTEIFTDGRYTFTTLGAERDWVLPYADLAQLFQLLGLPALRAEAKTRHVDTNCPDGRVYTLFVADLRIVFNDCEAEDHPAFRAVIEKVQSLNPRAEKIDP